MWGHAGWGLGWGDAAWDCIPDGHWRPRVPAPFGRRCDRNCLRGLWCDPKLSAPSVVRPET
eukprot:953262-Prorocentrum_minimum.AAC.1